MSGPVKLASIIRNLFLVGSNPLLTLRIRCELFVSKHNNNEYQVKPIETYSISPGNLLPNRLLPCCQVDNSKAKLKILISQREIVELLVGPLGLI